MNNNIDQQPHSFQLSHQQWVNIFDATPDGLLITDKDFNILFVNRTFTALLETEESDLVGKKCFEAFSCALCHTSECPLARVKSREEPLTLYGGDHCKNGRKVSWIVTTSAYPDDTGSIGGYVERITDASQDIKQMQEELSRSHERLRKNMGAIIQAMSTTIEKRDPYTAGHQRRVAKLCRAIATRMGFSWEQVQGLRMAAAIHDLGKIHVPAEILNRPGPISKHERAIIKMHPRTGYEILKGIQFPWPLAETIYQHHERLDGTGYPRGLEGEQILMEARILAVADVVETMASFRPYRPELGLDAALEEITKHRGSLYDPAVVDICLALISEQGFDFKTKNWQQRNRKL